MCRASARWAGVSRMSLSKRDYRKRKLRRTAKQVQKFGRKAKSSHKARHGRTGQSRERKPPRRLHFAYTNAMPFHVPTIVLLLEVHRKVARSDQRDQEKRR